MAIADEMFKRMNDVDRMTAGLILEIMKDRTHTNFVHEVRETDDVNGIRQPILRFLEDYSAVYDRGFDLEQWTIYLDVVRGAVANEGMDDPQDALTKICHAMAHAWHNNRLVIGDSKSGFSD